ncbi:Na+/H+ antiporter [Mangrovibrevibacter kandeliae]|uniref:Na+/H+ antiporter n=1 Tax=Mangrovibrevibacter kandeliae TaxID=2968473 RepID=UPI002117A9CA|nr:Na+/H+ antiporter [Aurantimonas sp. CSK15Z-1]MCQ8781404.1 Na+/H+ antiporter [Aurantimonas sp. CSK15Z-1]
MAVFETILVMLAVAVLLLGAARRWHLPYPVLLAIAGAAVAFAPIDLGLALDPDLVLALFVAPVLLDAAYDTSLRDLRHHWKPVLSLALVAVGLTTAAVAWVVQWMTPGLPTAAAIAIGAIVAPPDAVAATTVLRDLKLPHRLAVILNGEALLNDASTLLIYRLAVAAVAAGGSVGAEVVAPAFLLSVVVSTAAGPLLGWVTGRLIPLIEDPPTSIILQFVTTFGVWVLAERLGLSPILTVVGYAMYLARSGRAYMPARMRVPSYAVWDTTVVVLNVLAFLLIGLELGPVIAQAKPGEIGRWIEVGGAVLATVILVRLLWTMAAALYAQRYTRRLPGEPRDDGLPSWRTGLVIGWAGTRGIVTFATALALPGDFPERGMLLFAAFAVTLGTLLIQGLTLRPLVMMLRFAPDDTVDAEVRRARVRTAEAAMKALEARSDQEAAAVRAELVRERDFAADATAGDGRPSFPIKALRAEALARRRQKLLTLRRNGEIGDEAFHRLEEELDLADMATATRI